MSAKSFVPSVTNMSRAGKPGLGCCSCCVFYVLKALHLSRNTSSVDCCTAFSELNANHTHNVHERLEEQRERQEEGSKEQGKQARSLCNHKGNMQEAEIGGWISSTQYDKNCC